MSKSICSQLTDNIINEPPSSWVKAAMEADLVYEQHDAMATLMEAVKCGFSLENIQCIVKCMWSTNF